MATFTLTGTANDLVGDGPTRTMRGYVQPSQPVINDADANVQHYGNKALTFDETGAWTIDLLETGEMVAAYRVVIEYVDDAPGTGSPSSRQVQRAVSNYFDLTADTEFGSVVAVDLTPVTTDVLESVYDARDEAEAAAAAAVAVGTTNDTIIASRVNDPASATRTALTSTFVPRWAASTAYATDAVVLAPTGQTIKRIASGTSRPAYDATEIALWSTLTATAAQVASAYTVATRGFPVRTRPVSKMIGFFGAAGHGWGYSAGGSDDTTVPMLGTQSAKLVVAASGNQNLTKTALTAFSVVGKNVRLWFRLHGAGATSVTVYLASDNTVTNRVQRSFLLFSNYEDDVDYVYDIPISEFTTVGTPDLANIICCRIFVAAGASNGVTANFGGVALTSDAVASLPNGAVVISADDCSLDQWSYLRPQLAKYGYGATLYINNEAVQSGSGTTFTVAQAQYMQRVHGFDVGAHCDTAAHHVDVTTLTEAQIRAMCEQIISDFRSWGLRGNSYAYPNGTFNATVKRVLADYFRTARTTTAAPIETYPPLDPMEFRAVNTGIFTLAEMKAMVDKAKASHAVVHFFFHTLPVTDVTQNDTARQIMIDLIDYIAAQAVPVYTMSQLMELSVA